MAKPHASSIQEFGLNQFPQMFSHISDGNMGYLLPLMWDDVPFGSHIRNNVDLFSRSSPLTDPAFLDFDISIGHYFVAYEAMDPLFRLRARNFKRSVSKVDTPVIDFNVNDLFDSTSPLKLNCAFTSEGLLGRLGLGLQVPPGASAPAPNSILPINAYPLIAYHMVCDWFFSARNFQNPYRTQEAWQRLLSSIPIGQSPNVDMTQITNVYGLVDEDFVAGGAQGTAEVYPYNIHDLRTCNFEPDYFSATRLQPGGPDVGIPGTSTNSLPGTVHNLLDSQLLQKVADMLYYGGYSLNDLVQTLYGYDPGNRELVEPMYLGGTTAPFTVSTVTQQSVSADNSPLGTQAGNTSAYANGSNQISHFATNAGIYLVLAWIRPRTYYNNYVDRKLLNQSFEDFLIPQLADATNDPIYSYEVTGDIRELLKAPDARQVFGFADRYENYRTKVNRVSGSIPINRQSWYLPRLVEARQGTTFVNMANNVVYSPWAVTDKEVPHFFFRAYMNYQPSHLLPARSKPFIW